MRFVYHMRDISNSFPSSMVCPCTTSYTWLIAKTTLFIVVTVFFCNRFWQLMRQHHGQSCCRYANTYVYNMYSHVHAQAHTHTHTHTH